MQFRCTIDARGADVKPPGIRVWPPARRLRSGASRVGLSSCGTSLRTAGVPGPPCRTDTRRGAGPAESILKRFRAFGRFTVRLNRNQQALELVRMGAALNKNDVELLTQLAEYRLLTVSQLAALRARSLQGVRRRMRWLEQEQLLRATTRGFGHGRGRPEKLISLADAGVDLLRRRELLPAEVRTEQVTADGVASPEHQLLTNWFRIHLVQMERTIPRLAVEFLSPTSPLLPPSPDGSPGVSERVAVDGGRHEPIRFTPDGVFSIADRESEKTLLFFLEVDMGTETLASPARHQRDVRQKVINYQAYFRSGGYKRYQSVWNRELNGFRLLFLTSSAGRLADLCRLVQEMPPADFIWLTDERRMFEQGVSAAIWARGGNDRAVVQSILGRGLAQPAPIAVTQELPL